MIQRIQTFYLVLGAATVAALFFLQPEWQLSDPRVDWFVPVALGLAILIIVVDLVSIFLYKDRNRQFKVVLYLQLLTLALIAVFIAGYYIAGELSSVVEGKVDPTKLISVMLPFIAYVCFSFARRGIDRDIKLIKSMDRLR